MQPVRTALALAVLTLLAGSALAQDTAPYVSRLVAQPGTKSILLTWQDAEGYPGASYEVWRSSKEIVKDGLSQAQMLATVKEGVQAYEDTTAAADSYYAVLLKDADGNRKGYFVPYRNKTASPVKPDQTSVTVTARIVVGAVGYAAPQLQIPFQVFPNDRKLMVFRRAGPITSVADLKDATLLGTTTGAQSPWKDTPSPGLEFYYAVLDAQAFAEGRDDAFGDTNATTVAAGFPLVSPVPDATAPVVLPTGPTARALPLPRLLVEAAPATGEPLAPPPYQPVAKQALSAPVQAALTTWSKGPSATLLELPDRMVLPEERTGTATGAAKYLVQIQSAYLDPKDWKGAVDALKAVLKLTLDARTEARARFYLGEAYAGQKDYRPAFFEFLSAREAYPAETKPYLEALISLLAATPD